MACPTWSHRVWNPPYPDLSWADATCPNALVWPLGQSAPGCGHSLPSPPRSTGGAPVPWSTPSTSHLTALASRGGGGGRGSRTDRQDKGIDRQDHSLQPEAGYISLENPSTHSFKSSWLSQGHAISALPWGPSKWHMLYLKQPASCSQGWACSGANAPRPRRPSALNPCLSSVAFFPVPAPHRSLPDELMAHPVLASHTLMSPLVS